MARDLIPDLEEALNAHRKAPLIVAPSYTRLCKALAELYFNVGDEENGIFYLTESHGVQLREDSIARDYVSEVQKVSRNGLSAELIGIKGSRYSDAKYDGMMERLKQMPPEWTLIQLTLPLYDEDYIWYPRKCETVLRNLEVRVVRFPCGGEEKPSHILIPKPTGLGPDACSMFEILHKSTIQHYSGVRSGEQASKKREEESICIKEVVQNLTQHWLKEWSIMLLGKLCDEKIEETILSALRSVLDNRKELKSHMGIFFQIAQGSAYYEYEEEIELALYEFVKDEDSRKEILNVILDLKEKITPHRLITTKRYPVILLLDEKLEFIPWEMTSVLRRHPVTRLPSLHFAHALYKKFEESIVKGNRHIGHTGYFLVNPGNNLVSTEQRLKAFLNLRFPQWEGCYKKAPEKNEIIRNLLEKDVFLYCGHGNGTQYISTEDIDQSDVKAIPLLFGCSSVQHKDPGGCLNYNCLASNYIVSGCPSVLGMLWSITSHDADHMCMMLLNHWLPGKYLSSHEMEKFLYTNSEGKTFRKESKMREKEIREPELLRALTLTKKTANFYSNMAAIVAYGIPITCKTHVQPAVKRGFK